MIPFAHVSLQEIAIEILTIRAVTGLQILAERYFGCG
jgi:hypothetical protein